VFLTACFHPVSFASRGAHIPYVSCGVRPYVAVRVRVRVRVKVKVGFRARVKVGVGVKDEDLG
jgi:hypothetical protein